VGTAKKSTETRSATWFCRNVRQVCEGDFGRRGMRRATVRCDTSKPSLSSSPWMRGAPQRGLARAMVRTRWAIAEPIDGRPVRALRDFHVQKARSRGPNRGRFERVAEQGELLPERQILKRKITAVPERSTRRAQESEYEGHCAPASLGVIPSSSVTIEFWQTTTNRGGDQSSAAWSNRRKSSTLRIP